MYNFIDTNEASEGRILPAEAMLFNGEYLEDQIDGYRTLNVSGREALSPELSGYETGVRDGATLQSKRYPARVITVTYQLIAKTNEAYREAYNKLGGILDKENAEIIFADEPDKYFTGTVSNLPPPDAGRNAVTGEIEITCFDPFKYSVEEYEATASLDNSSVLIDYGGTYKAYPKLIAEFYNEKEIADDGTAGTLTGNGDCGFVSFFTEDEKIIQLGDPDEADKVEQEKSVTLINQSFTNSQSWSAAASGLWSANTGAVLPSTVTKSGTVGLGVSTYTEAGATSTHYGQLISVWSDAGAPAFLYTVSAKTSDRTATSVKVTVSITASMKNTTSWFGVGLGLQGSLYVGGAWHNVTIKDKPAYWSGKTEHIVNMSFTITGLSADTASLTGIKFKVTRTDSGVTSGAVSEKACSNLTIPKYITSTPATYYLHAANYGTGSGWLCAAITRTIGADSTGVSGAEDFTFSWRNKMLISSSSTGKFQLGGFQIQLTTTDGVNVAGVRVLKGAAGNSATMYFYVHGAIVKSTMIDIASGKSPFASESSASSTITKSNSKVTFNVGGISYSATDSAIASLVTAKITVAFERYAPAATLAHNGLFYVKFVRNNVDKYRDIPNKFSAGDVVEADCKDGKIFLNGLASPMLGALGNDWEGFTLTSGLNQIGFAYSDWVAAGYEPTIKIKYREVYL